LLIATGPDAVSGVWRVPDANTAARNYYLIVEALDDAGRLVTGGGHATRRRAASSASPVRAAGPAGGVRAGRADKRDDGIIQDRYVGEKARGELEPEYVIPTTGGAITRW
jgi:hypothetical protein